MSLNRVIGAGNQIPWHLPEDFKWFKQTTMGNVVVMGRKTFESLGKPLPNRKNLILTQHPQALRKKHPAVFQQYQEWRGGQDKGRPLKTAIQFPLGKLDKGQPTEALIISSPDKLNPDEFPNDIFICGGAQIYEQLLPRCSDLYLTVVKREVAGDAFFPPFEDKFELVEELRDTPEFKILHYRHKSLKAENQGGGGTESSS